MHALCGSLHSHSFGTAAVTRVTAVDGRR